MKNAVTRAVISALAFAGLVFVIRFIFRVLDGIATSVAMKEARRKSAEAMANIWKQAAEGEDSANPSDV